MSVGEKEVLALPRIVYVGEVPVESSYHGSALLYRLLQRYPEDRLRIVEVMHQSQSARRLAGVRYSFFRPPLFRWLSTRLHDYAKAVVSVSRRLGAIGLQRECLGGFGAEAVLTVGHGLGWLVAAELAARNRIPLHVIIHDDWPGSAWKVGWVNHRIVVRFEEVYRVAASRLCVSPYMADEYERRYGSKGTVLYPSRAAGAASFLEPPGAPEVGRPYTIGYAGTLYPDHAKTLKAVALELVRLGGRLLLFGPFDGNRLTQFGLDLDCVECGGLVDSEELIRRLRSEADVLFVPMSFAEDEREVARFSFPSKLADYTRAGLPLLVAGPPDSSAVRWADSNPGVAEVVHSQAGPEIASAVRRLAESSTHRRNLAECAIRVGTSYFSHESAERILFAHLRGGCRSHETGETV